MVWNLSHPSDVQDQVIDFVCCIQMGTLRITVDGYLPVFASLEVSTNQPGRASIGGFFKAQARYDIVYRNGDQCKMSGCTNLPSSCVPGSWLVCVYTHMCMSSLVS
jgi:hypothetical protein